jgi:hypothetical protein
MLSSEKLKQNALTSIRLGVEDFQMSTKAAADGGDPERALSAVRNLFAGMLLLFKYALARRVTNTDEVDSVLFNPPRQIVPHPDGSGGVVWRPVGKFSKQTIDVEGIKARFVAFKIVVDWDALGQLQDERNHLEHLHPTQSVGAIAGFVADMFPILRDFVVDELDEVPSDFLGAGWTIMLEHKAFFAMRLQECMEAWTPVIPDGVLKYAEDFRCAECGSQLVAPSEEDEDKYSCVACGAHDEFMPQIVDLIIEEEGGYSPHDGHQPSLLDCPDCDKPVFVVSEGCCRWCDYELEDWECMVCGDGLGLDDQGNNGLCSYHANQVGKDD